MDSKPQDVEIYPRYPTAPPHSTLHDIEFSFGKDYQPPKKPSKSHGPSKEERRKKRKLERQRRRDQRRSRK